MQKICASCCVAKPLGAFAVRAASSDGRASSCKACINLRNRAKYAIDPSIRALAVARAGAVKARRSQAEPGYRRALVLWQSTKRRGTKIPPWVQIKDFVPLCRKAERLGSEYEIDHIIPLNHPLVCGLHVPANIRVVLRKTNRRKGRYFAP